MNLQVTSNNYVNWTRTESFLNYSTSSHLVIITVLFSSPVTPSITHLGFTHGPISSNLTCISTVSPATIVTWMRDGQQLSFNDDTYKLIQTVTDRRQSTYKNVLIIKAAASDIFGHTYSCTIINILGAISEALTACTYSGA